MAERQRGLEGGAVARPPARASAPPSASHTHLGSCSRKQVVRTINSITDHRLRPFVNRAPTALVAYRKLSIRLCGGVTVERARWAVTPHLAICAETRCPVSSCLCNGLRRNTKAISSLEFENSISSTRICNEFRFFDHRLTSLVQYTYSLKN